MFAVVIMPRAGRRQTTAALAIYAAAAALVPLAIVGWLAAAGALEAWRDLVRDYLVPVYTSLRPASRWEIYRPQAWAPIAVGVTLSVTSTLARRALTVRHVVAMLGVAYGVFHYVVQGKGWDYHLYRLVAFAAVALFAELEAALAWRPLAVGVPLVACCLTAAALLGARGIDAVPTYFASAKVTHVRYVVGDLARITRPDDLVQVLDTTEGGVHALLVLGLRQPTRFLCDFPLFATPDAPITARYRAGFIAGFDARPPRAVVVFARAWPSGGPERVGSFPALAERLAHGLRDRGAASGLHDLRQDQGVTRVGDRPLRGARPRRLEPALRPGRCRYRVSLRRAPLARRGPRVERRRAGRGLLELPLYRAARWNAAARSRSGHDLPRARPGRLRGFVADDVSGGAAHRLAPQPTACSRWHSSARTTRSTG